MNDLSTEESPIRSNQSLKATSVVTDENVFVESDIDEEDESASNKVTEAAGVCMIYGCCEYQGIISRP